MLSRLFITLSNISEEICSRLWTVEEHLTGLHRELVTGTHAESALYTVPLSHGDLFPSRSDLDLPYFFLTAVQMLIYVWMLPNLLIPSM